jgi:outer membrane protein assembly factor BamB
VSRLRIHFHVRSHAARLAAFLALLAPCAAQYQEVWSTNFGGRHLSFIGVLDLEVSHDGSLWIAAQAGRQVRSFFGSLPNLLLLRYAPDGHLAWIHNMGGAASYPSAWGGLKLDSEGCAFVASQIGQATTLTKFSPSGVELWQRDLELGWSGGSPQLPMAIDGQGRVVVAGNTPGVPPERCDLLVAQYDTDGNLRWQVSHDGPLQGYDVSRHVAVDAWGRVHLTAVSTLQQPDDPGNVILSVAFDGDGELLWSSPFVVSGTEELDLQAVEVQADGTRSFAVGVHDPDLYWWSQTAFALARIRPTGEIVWTVVAPNEPQHSRYCWELLTAPWGDLIVSGTKAYHPNPTGFLVKVRGLAQAYSPTGQKLWSQEAQCPGTQFEEVFVQNDPEHLGFVTSLSNGSCNPTADLTLEFLSARGAPLGVQSIDLPGVVGFSAPSVSVDDAGDLRLIGSDAMYGPIPAAYLYVARYTLE